MKIWLDDIRPAPKGWVWARNYMEAVLYLDRGEVTEISLDHDLGEDELTGYDLVRNLEFLVGMNDWPFQIPIFHIHSANPVGRKNMQAAIDSIQRLVENESR